MGDRDREWGVPFTHPTAQSRTLRPEFPKELGNPEGESVQGTNCDHQGVVTGNENYVARWNEQEIMSEKEETGSSCHRKVPGERREVNQKG